MEERKRILELVAALCIAAIMLAMSRLETRLFSLSQTLSEHREISTTIAYFALINVNVILVLALSFLIIRNVVKLLLERKRGILGSKLKTKLVVSLVFFALAPTLLLFYVSARFVTKSFDEWFSEKVTTAMHQTREAGAAIYEQDEKRMRSLASIAVTRTEVIPADQIFLNDQARVAPGRLKGFDKEYGLSSLTLFSVNGTTVWSTRRGYGSEIPERTSDFVIETFEWFRSEKGLSDRSAVEAEAKQDVVKVIAPVFDPLTGELIGAVLTEEKFQTQILKSVEKILADFAVLKPGAQLIRMSYLILMVLMTLLITFSAIWMGFYVAKAITGPLQSLAEATREVALGNYAVNLRPQTDDETGQLVRSFNMMTRDLENHQNLTLKAQATLQRSNVELERRRQHMEIVLKNITAGVISVDINGTITSCNRSAEKHLDISGVEVTGLSVEEGLGPLFESFWQPISAVLQKRSSYHGQVDVKVSGADSTLVVDAVTIEGEDGSEGGCVIVFEDAREQARAQRVAAWREVARRIAHEIKNPITPIKLNAQRLLRKFNGRFDGDDREVFENCLEIIIKQVDSLRDLVNEFSKFSRLPTVKPIPEDVNEILSDVTSLFSLSYPEVKLDLRLATGLPMIPLDRDQITRTFVNLVTNSVAALVEERPGEIVFQTSLIKELNMVRVEISDNGCGIAEEFLDRVLEPYFSTKDEGTGLGLAIVNQIVSDHGGYLRLVGNKPWGTRVVVELPIDTKIAGA
jgi:two-component system nitrogen regulation sensor histidine kinase NtrY